MRFFEIIDQVLSYHPQADVSLIEKAYVVSAKLHCGEACLSGESYLDHCLEVAGVLAHMRLDEETVVGGLLQGSLWEGKLAPEDLEADFGPNVTRIVQGVTKLSQLKYTSYEESQAEYLRKMILAMSPDVRVVFVKLADRLCHMRTIERHDEEVRELLARETLDIYAPLAARLGIDWMKRELEDASFRCLHPREYEDLVRSLAKTEEERRSYIEEVKSTLGAKMAEHGLKGRVQGRSKHLYSIYKKMSRQNLDINRVHDLIAFRIILDSNGEDDDQRYKDCYEALGMVQALWEPVPGRFKDYISRPKPNGYMSLHTTVKGRYGEHMEVQIRTEEMDRVANEGIAAHWIYKEKRSSSPADMEESRRFSWLRQLLEWKRDSQDPKEVLDSVKVDLYPDEVYVLTPQNEVKAFPKGATPVDFAYEIHTEVGHRCVGARVNGKIVPLHYELQNGDVIEILTAKKHRPSKDWLKIVKTSKARERIRRWIKMEERERSIATGREMCEREFRKKGLSFNHYINSPELEEVARSLSLRSVDDLLASVGYRKLSPTHVLGRLFPSSDEEESEKDEIVVEKRKPSRTDEGVRVTGVEDVMTHMAKCCHPLPGEPIVGYVTRGRGITVHHADCKKIEREDKNRLIEVQWDTGDNQSYPVDLRVSYFNERGMLGMLSSLLSQMDTRVIDVQMRSHSNERDVCLLKVEVKDMEHLGRVMTALKGEKNVHSVQRIKE